MADIIDVAKRANVSKSTVSRVLNNNGYVAKSTREKIEKAIKELNYCPSPFAQNIRTHKTRTIAMMIPDSSNTFYMEIFKAVERITLKNGYMVILCDTRRSADNEYKYAEKLIQRNVDGLIYFAQQKEEKGRNYFVELSKKFPIVFMDYIFSDTPDISCVAMESRECSAEAVKYLYSLGKRRIAYINLPKTNNVTLLRCEGYRQGLRECGLSDIPDLVSLPRSGNNKTLIEVGYAATCDLLKRNRDVDAIMTASDHLAVGVVKCLRHQGVRIPQDIAVIGFDDIDLCEVVSPALTTIRQPIKEMGVSAAELLLEMIREGKILCKKVIYKGELVKRHSTELG